MTRQNGCAVGAKIAILDDHRLFGHGLAGLLAELGDIQLHQNVDTALAALHKRPVDLLLLDFYVPGQNAPDTITTVLKHQIAAGVIVISASLSPVDRTASIAAGALAYATKHMSPDALLTLCRDALSGRLTQSQPKDPNTDATHAAQQIGLTLRQLDVLVMVGHGYSNPEIADLLSIRLDTVKTHLKAAFHRLGASNRTEAIMLARDRGLL